MAIQSRRGNISDFDKSKMLPGEWGIALDSQEAFVCFGAGTTKKMATYEDYQDMIDDCITVTQTAQGVVDSFNNLEIEKLAIDDASVSYITGWSSEKITKHDTKDNVVTYTETATRENISTGEKHSVLFGKIRKWFSDLKSVAFTGKYTDLTNVAIENPTTLPTASADTLGKIYRDGTGLKITLRSGNEGSYIYSWVPFISKDKVVNSFNVTEDGFVADARTVKMLKDSVDAVNNNLTWTICGLYDTGVHSVDLSNKREILAVLFDTVNGNTSRASAVFPLEYFTGGNAAEINTYIEQRNYGMFTATTSAITVHVISGTYVNKLLIYAR